MAREKPVKQSKFIDSRNFDIKQHANMVDRDLTNLFLYTRSLASGVSGGSSAIAEPVYFGPVSSDGTWRIAISGDNLAVQRRESGSWVEKGAYLP